MSSDENYNSSPLAGIFSRIFFLRVAINQFWYLVWILSKGVKVARCCAICNNARATTPSLSAFVMFFPITLDGLESTIKVMELIYVHCAMIAKFSA